MINVTRLSLLYVILISSVCAQTTTDDLHILNATEEQWTTAATLKNKGAKGKIYSVLITPASGKILELREIVIDGLKLPFEVVKNKSRNFKGAIAPSDTVLIVARSEKGKHYQKASRQAENEKGRGYLIYEINKKSFVRSIASFSESRKKVKNQ